MLKHSHNKPTKKCNKCNNYYGSEHFTPHLDLLPDIESNTLVQMSVLITTWIDVTNP
jgi:hypothetical protein